MKNTLVKLLLFLLSFGILSASEIETSAPASALTIYSHRHYEADQKLFAQFTQKTGIKVNVVKAGADELIERIKAEGAHTKADILITADAGRLERAKSLGLLEALKSENLSARIPAHLRDPDGTWFGFTQRARIIAYAKDRVKPEELSTYENLADPKWRSRILVRSSANIYNQSLLASLLAANGEEKALAWAKAVRKNMARPPQGSDRDQMRAVAAGLGDIALVNTYYLGVLHHSPEEKDRKVAASIGIFFPNQAGESARGAHVNISGAGIIKASKNKSAALQFLEFLASDEAQKTFPNATYEYPVVKNIPWSELQKSWGSFTPDTLNLSTLGKLNQEAVKTFNQAGWE